jgi:DNA invertase Pin-like site-specific DNA recombinase
MMLDMLAAVARKDYEDRRRRQAQGIVKAKAAGAYRGRPEDTARNAGIAGMLHSGMTLADARAILSQPKGRGRPSKERLDAERVVDEADTCAATQVAVDAYMRRVMPTVRRQHH